MAASIVVGDADKITRELIATVLAREGFEVTAAHDAPSVLAFVAQRPTALVVASATLPGGAAAELGPRVREIAADTRVVLLVASYDLEATDPGALATSLRCEAVLPRPFRYAGLKALLAGWGIGAPRRKEPRGAPTGSFSVPVPEPAAFDVASVAAPEPPAAEAPSDASLGVAPTPAAPDAGFGLVPIPIPLPPPAPTPEPAVAAPLELDLAALELPPAAATPAVEPPAAAASPLAIALELPAAAAPPLAMVLEPPAAAAPPAIALEPPAAAAPPAIALELPAAAAPPPAVETDAAEDAYQDELVLDDLMAEESPTPEPAAPALASPLASAPPAVVAPPAPAAPTPVERRPFFGGLAPSRAVEPPAVALPASTAAAASAPALVPQAGALASAPPAGSSAAPRAAAPRARPVGLPARGELQATPLPRILFELYAATFSGKLTLEREGLRRVIYVWGGLPVRVDSEQVEESLGRVLLEHGRITPDQYEMALAAATEHHVPEADALIASGAIEKRELLDIVREQTDKRLVNSFGWRDAHYTLEADTHFGERMILTEVQPLKAIWRGVSEHFDLGSLMVYFGGLRGQYAVGTELFEVHAESLGPFLRKLAIAALLDGRTTFQAALRSDDTRALEIAQALYVLLVTDMVRASPTPGAPVTLPEHGEPEGLEMTAPVDYRAITRTCDDVNREYLRVKESDYFDTLRVEATATPDIIDTAYTNLVRQFTLEALPAGLPEDVQRRAAELCSLLARARNTLRDPAARDRYVDSQRARYADAAPAPGGAARPPPTFVDGAELDLDRTAEQDRETRQLAERAFSDAGRLIKAGDLELAVQKLAVAVRLNANEAGYRVTLAKTRLALRDDAASRRDAASLLQQALKLEPSHVDANYELARLLVAASQPNLARPYIMRVLQRAPEHREARALLGQIAS